jgi:hypothetical protein
MKKILFLLAVTVKYLLLPVNIYSQSVAVNSNGANADASAMLDISSSSKGLLMPRMTMAERNSINNPATGLIIFQTDGLPGFYFNAGTAAVPNWTMVGTVSGGDGGVWAANGSGIYNTNTGNVGIGTNSPTYDLHINRSSPSIGFFDNAKNHFSGFISGDSSNLQLNAYRKNFSGFNQAGNLIMQVGESGINPLVAGNVGIGTSSPDVKLHINGGSETGSASGGYLQLGSTTAINLGVDNNEIQARNNGVVSKLGLQNSGGGIEMGGATLPAGYGLALEGSMHLNTSNNKITRAGSGTAGLLPIVFGKIDWDGVIIGGTNNFSVAKTGLGDFSITLTNEPTIFTNGSQYIILVTPTAGTAIIGVAKIESDNTVRVRISKPAVHYSNSACACELFSHITDGAFYDYTDYGFSILIFKT